MKLTLSKEYEFIPDWNDNQYDDQPIKIICKYLTQPDRDKCFKIEYTSDTENKSRLVVIPQKQYFAKFAIKEIQNLEIGNDKIKTADQLIATPRLGGLYNEIVDYIIAEEDRAQRELKN